MKKNIFYIILMLFLIVSMVACSKAPKDNNPDTNPNSNEDEVQDITETEKNVTIYYSDADATNLVKKNITIKPQDNTLEEEIIGKLKEQPSDENLFAVIPSNVSILSVRTEKNITYVDVSSEDLYGGSTQERFMIDGIVMSLTELENIEKVQFLIDGNKAETLMGHYTIEEPFTRDDIATPIIE